MNWSIRTRTYVYSDTGEFPVTDVDGQKRIYVNGDPLTDDGEIARIGMENVCDGCGRGVPLTAADAIRFDIVGGGPDCRLSTGGFYHVACLPDFLRSSVQGITAEASSSA